MHIYIHISNSLQAVEYNDLKQEKFILFVHYNYLKHVLVETPFLTVHFSLFQHLTLLKFEHEKKERKEGLKNLRRKEDLKNRKNHRINMRQYY